MIETALVLPSPPALLAPQSVTDPVAELRTACQAAVVGLPSGQKVIVLANPVSEANAARGITEPLGHRVARSLLGEVEFEPQLALPYAAAALLVRLRLALRLHRCRRGGKQRRCHQQTNLHEFLSS